MCEDALGSPEPSSVAAAQPGQRGLRALDIGDLLPNARALAQWPETRTSHVGFVGYGATVSGHKVLIAVDREYDPLVPEAIARALREKGAHVDIITVDMGDPEKEFDHLDEVRVSMRRGPWDNDPRRWEGMPWIEAFAGRRGYDLLIHGKGGPVPQTPYRYEQFPWLRCEHFMSRATVYPLDLHYLINQKAWAIVWEKGKGGRARLTDPEGTDLSWTYWDEYYGLYPYGFAATPRHGHLLAHPPTPLIAKGDAAGVVAGTTSNFSRPFPRVRVEVEAGQIARIAGGGGYGDAWRGLLEESQHTQYPCFPRPGLFYLWEVAIGTNPNIARPSRIDRYSSGGTEWERRRSGIIHVGFGTLWRAPEEKWAADRGILYGHLHVHLLMATLVVTAKDGTEHTVIRNGRLIALDDPEVRALASKYGDPDQLLSEDWVPQIPGISCPGSYQEYVQDPAAWIYTTRP
ncbi:MAG: hypothetical protein HYY01_03935 [Chloroflexi bacterium]|nr:hypothetical protein [Chloroflexota bacterium]